MYVSDFGCYPVTGQLVAVKRMLLTTRGVLVQALREVAILSKLKHKNILEMDHYFVSKEAVYLVLELLTTDLRNFLNAIPDGQFLEENLLKLYCFQVIFHEAHDIL